MRLKATRPVRRLCAARRHDVIDLPAFVRDAAPNTYGPGKLIAVIKPQGHPVFGTAQSCMLKRDRGN